MLQTVSTAGRMALLAIAIGLAGAAVPAGAASPGDAAMRRWKTQDNCVADATKKEPDHTAAALHKRDGLVNDCLKAHGMPPIDGVAPSDTPPAAAASSTPAPTPPQ